MHKVRRDRRKDVHTRLDFREGLKERTREDFHHSSVRARTTKREWEKVQDRLRYGDRHVLDRLGYEGRGRGRPYGLDTLKEDRPKDRERFRSVGESYDDPFSYSYRDGNRSRHMKRRRDNESLISSVSRSDSSDGRKYVKDPVEIHNIKQKDGETIEDFMERFKVETIRMKGAPECMRISRFMHGVNNPKLTKRLNEHVPKTIEEMMITTIAFIRGEAAAASKKKGHASWKAHDQSKRQNSDKRSDFRGHSREGRGSNWFTPPTRTPKKILGPRRIEELVRAGKLSHLIKEIKHGRDQSKTGKKETTTKDKPTAIYMIQSWQRTTRQKVTQSFKRVKEIKFPPLAASSDSEGPLVIEAEIGEHMIHCMYVDGGSSIEILYEHCFNRLWPEIKSQMVPATTSLTGFSGETIRPLGQLRLLVIIGDSNHSTREWMNFMMERSLSPYNGIIGRPGIRAIQAVPSTDCYPMPEIDWKVESLCGYSFKCFLDAYNGYHQIQLAEPDEEKTTFHTGQGVYCYTKMPFGLKIVGATYRRLMDKAFESQIGRNIEVYVDDLVVKSYTEAEMMRDIEETFRTLRKINMKLNPKKCLFGLAEGMFLGYVSLNGKLAGLNRFLFKAAKKSLPLFKTLKRCIKKGDFHWTVEAEQAFKQLKHHLLELPLLVAPKPKEELIIYLSATHKAISTVLMTERGATQTPINFIRRALQGPKLNYTLMEKLVLSLVFAAKRLQRHFQAHPFTLITDQPIEQIMYHPDVVLADFLIKMPGKNPQAAPAAETQQEPWTLFMDGSSCVDRSGARHILTNPKGIEFTYALRFQFAAPNNEAVYEALIAGLQIAARMGVKMYISTQRQIHKREGGGNRGGGGRTYLDDTDSRVFKRRNSPRRQEGGKKAPPQGPTVRGNGGNPLHAVVPYVVVKIHHPITRSPQQPPTPITAPWLFYKWGIDIAGPFPEGPDKVKFLIVAMDYFMKWIEAKAAATITGGQVKKFVWDNIVCHFGLPVKHPQSNRLIERANRSLGEGIKACLEFRMPTYCTAAVDVVSNDEELRLNLDLLEERRERAAICEAKAKSKMKKYYNARVRGISFSLGDIVYCSNDASHAVVGGKLGPKWEGPYEVTEALEDGAYKLRSMDRTILPRT
uniref:Reverse transcriptase domain-containing protein n=1 Tax=Tanacetum cinerariifolium TaxID=118510 RepID=A0A6L2JVU1_TANCI|nr:reverse transcriptase domain-containing protein [Tanacetum cinerariifolium]